MRHCLILGVDLLLFAAGAAAGQRTGFWCVILGCVWTYNRENEDDDDDDLLPPFQSLIVGLKMVDIVVVSLSYLVTVFEISNNIINAG